MKVHSRIAEKSFIPSLLLRFRNHPFLTAIATVLALVTLMFISWPRERITPANFAKIQIGMSKAELRSMFGPAENETVELGIIGSSGAYGIVLGHPDPQDLRRKGYREYIRQTWISPAITITAVSDLEGKVVCRYSGDGQVRNRPRTFLSWFTELF